MKIIADIIGDLRQQMAEAVQREERAVLTGVSRATEKLKLDLRSQTVGAGLGTRLSNTWRSNVKPKQPSTTADGLVWTKAPWIMRTHAFGAVIKGRDGLFLAVPLPAAGKSLRGGRISPREWEHRAGRALQFIYRRGKPSLLVARGTFGSKGQSITPIFVLLPQVRLRKRLDVEGAAEAAHRNLQVELEKAWVEEER